MMDNQRSSESVGSTLAPLTTVAVGGGERMADSHLKRCFKCGDTKPRGEFYRHPQMGDGLLGKCKDCTKADVRNYWRENAYVLRQTDGLRRRLQKQCNT